jgi:cobalt-zinc-cadmium efflux system membrane fusion protein
MNGPLILIVDDDAVLSEVLRRVLTRDGYTVETAGSVAEALGRARTRPPALALVDLILPDGDGADLARQLEAQGGRIPLILITASPQRLHDQPELARGFAHVLTKPLNLDELRQTIAASLAVAAPAADASAPTGPEPVRPVSAGVPARPRHRRRWAVLAGAVVAAAGLLAALPALGMPGLHTLLKRQDHAPPRAADSWAEIVPGADEEIELPRSVLDWLGVKTAQVEKAAAPRPLELAGSLSFDPTHLGRVQARFGGEVVSITKVPDNSGGPTRERQLRYGDPVRKGDVMAVVLSKDLGEKKSELVDSLVKLWLDEANLEKMEELARQNNIAPVQVRQQRAMVATDRNAVARAELTLRTWRVPDEEIAAVKAEANKVFSSGRRDLEKETEWAKVEVRAPFDGVIVEKNVALGNIVDTTFDLFKVADLRKLGVMVHAYEEDLRALQALPRPFPWRVRVGADPNGPVLKSEGMQTIGLVVDPTQHTDPVMGLVDNASGELRVGQFVTATVNLPAPADVVSLPASAVDEDGADSIVFVQPDPERLRFVRRRVVVAMRLRDVVYVKSVLPEEDWKKGLQAVRPGEWVVTEGVVELKAELEDLQAKKKAKK